MSEFIIDMPDDYSTNKWDVYYPDERDDPMPIGEAIVRCSDCKRCMAYAKATYCDLFAHRLPNNEIDGFCAWGDRGEDA